MTLVEISECEGHLNRLYGYYLLDLLSKHDDSYDKILIVIY